jgi:hypothetical protein
MPFFKVVYSFVYFLFQTYEINFQGVWAPFRYLLFLSALCSEQFNINSFRFRYLKRRYFVSLWRVSFVTWTHP